MTDSNTATERLREMLDARGVGWSDNSDENVRHTTWNDMNCWFNEFPDGWTAWGMAMRGTPEQAIAATLGAHSKTQSKTGDCLSEDGGSLSDATLGNQPPVDRLIRCLENDYGITASWDGLRKVWLTEAVEPWDGQAATLGSGECEWVLEHSGTLYDKWRCSECKFLFVEPRCDQGYTDLVPNYCPNCGAKVIGG